MQKAALGVLAVVSFSILVGCGLGLQPNGIGGYVLIPWRDTNGNYPFQKVLLLSLDSPRTLSSYRAKVFYRTGADGSGFTGKAVAPNIAQKGDMWIPLDSKSGISIAAFAIMERLYDFDKKMETLTDLRWPRQIGVEIGVKTSEGTLINNALYDMDKDVIALAPFHAKAVSVALNPGIIAHEHFHAHFASAWKGKDPNSPLKINGKTPNAAVNLSVILGWNEGLADYYGFVFTGDPNFIHSTFASRSQSEERHLNGDLMAMYAWQQLYDSMECSQGCQLTSKHIGYSYHNGTAIARFLYKWGNIHANGHERLLNHIHRRLPILMSQLRAGLETATVSPALLLEDLVATSNLGLTTELCRELFSVTSQVSPAPYFGKCQ